MTWPTLPAFSANNFLDHFPGSSLDARWTAVTSGTGSVTVTDSYASCNAPANSAAFIYLNVKLDKTKSQLWTAAIDMHANDNAGFAPRWSTVVNGASAPTGDSKANIDAKTLIDRVWSTDGENVFYYDKDAANSFSWDGAGGTEAWVASTGTQRMVNQLEVDDYSVIGLEIDGVNARFRVMTWCRSFVTPGTWEFDQGWRLMALSDWVLWTSVLSNDDVWLCFGNLVNDSATAYEVRIEWVRYAEALAGNTVVDAWNCGKEDASTTLHRIRHVYSYDGLTFLPDDRTSFALGFGAGGSYDENELQEPCCVFDGALTDYLFYTGVNSSFLQSICVASATHTSPQAGTWTKFASNPILSVGASGANDDGQVGFCNVVCDMHETDSNKRWKMFYDGFKNSDSKWRTLYATAPSPTGTWTKQGTVIDVGGAGAKDEEWARSAVIVNYNAVWEAWYIGRDASDVIRWLRATGTDLGSLTKDGVDYTPTAPSASQALTANMTTRPGRTVAVSSTTGFVQDASVVFSQSLTNTSWSYSQIRKVTDSTHLELYHGLTGFTTTYPARVRQVETSQNKNPRQIVQIGSEWWFYATAWEPFYFSSDSASYDALLEENHLFTHANAAPSGAIAVAQYQPSPVTSRGFNNDNMSFENMTLRVNPFGLGEVWLWKA